MSTFAIVLEETPVRLWGLSASERLRRQLKSVGGVIMLNPHQAPPGAGRFLLLDANFLFELRTLSGLLERDNTALTYPGDQRVAAAIVDRDHLETTRRTMQDQPHEVPPFLEAITPYDLAAFNEALRSAQVPLLEPVSEERKSHLENVLYGNAYRGITDLVTKFFWPRPARKAVHMAANLRLSPNTVTTVGLFLVVLASYLFLHGQYLAGLLAGWTMTFLDTVDGKLARVTVQSTQFGNLYDHAIDLLHPPFWYIFWGMSLSGLSPFMGFDREQMYILIVLGYVAGRVIEGVFSLLGDCSIFTWRPFDAYFRLVTARRNPCLVMLTASALIGRPDWGFVAVTAWTVLSTLILLVRLMQGALVRYRSGPLQSWLSMDDVAQGPYAKAFELFGSTRSAYGGE
jgi:phosphatidylglycerophosphate synthase